MFLAKIIAFIDDDSPLPNEELINMANVLIVSGSYFPYATANAVCVKKFEDSLKANGYNVIYCIRKHDINEPDYHIYEGTELYTIGKNSDLFYQTIDKLRTLDLPNSMEWCFNLAYKGFRAVMKLKNLGKRRHNLRTNAIAHYIDRYSDTIVSLIKNRNIDIVMSVSMPFLSHLAVLYAMGKMDKIGMTIPKWIAYSIDAYWSKEGTNPIDIPSMKAEEMEVFRKCNQILFLDSIANDYNGSEYDSLRLKMNSLPLPTFELNNVLELNPGGNRNVIRCLYAGTIYDGFRNLDGLIDIIHKLKDASIEFHFLGKIYPNSFKRLSKIAKLYVDKIFIHGIVPYEDALSAIQNSDILINLSNDNENQIPSKIFEYITNKKPVLNIYSNKKDIGTKYLKMYPLAYNYFYYPSMDDLTDELMEWINKSRNMQITNDELKLIYKEFISETITNSFINIVENMMKTSI